MLILAQLFSLAWQGFFKHTEGKLCPFLIPASSAATLSSGRVGIKLWQVGFRVYLCLEESFAGVEDLNNLILGVKTQQPVLLQSASEWKPKAGLHCPVRSD